MNQLLTSMGDASGRFRGAIPRAGERCEKSVWSQVTPVVKSAPADAVRLPFGNG